MLLLRIYTTSRDAPVARTLSRLGLGRLRNLEPKPPVQRYQWEQPGDLIQIDIKSLARFWKVGHRITGNRQQGRSYRVGYDKVHVAVDDATRLAYEFAEKPPENARFSLLRADRAPCGLVVSDSAVQNACIGAICPVGAP